MKIYKDIINGDEMFADTYKMRLVDEVIYEVYDKLVSRTEVDIQISGFNPSAEQADEGTDTVTETGVDIVLNTCLQKCFAFGDKKQLYLKDYMNKVLAQLEDLQFFTGESMDCDGMVAMYAYRGIDGVSTPVFMFFKHGLEEEKC